MRRVLSTFLLQAPPAVSSLGRMGTCAMGRPAPAEARCCLLRGAIPSLALRRPAPAQEGDPELSLGSVGATQLPAPDASAPLSCFPGLSNCKIKQKKRVNLQSGWQGP